MDLGFKRTRASVTSLLVLSLGLALGSDAGATTKPKSGSDGSPAKAANAEGDGKTGKAVRYNKRKQVDFSDQNIEGTVRRPEASLITAGETVDDNGILRLREDFLDKVTAFCGEEVL